jgi:hypothetical protein
VQRHFSSGGALVAALVLLVGCGGSSSSDQTAKFKASFSPVITQLTQISRETGTTLEHAQGQTDAQLGTVFHDLATRWQTQLSQLQTLKPPANVATAFNTLTGAAARVETDFTAIVSAAQTHSKSGATQATTSVVNDILSAKSASTTITTKLGIK